MCLTEGQVIILCRIHYICDTMLCMTPLKKSEVSKNGYASTLKLTFGTKNADFKFWMEKIKEKCFIDKNSPILEGKKNSNFKF